MKTNPKYNKLIDLAHSKEKDFDAFDKVWNRVEEKLDTQTVVHKKKFWKTTAIAASFVLTTTLAFVVYQLTKNDITSPKINRNTIEKSSNKDEFVHQDKEKSIIDTAQALKIIENQKTDVVIVDKKIFSPTSGSITNIERFETNPISKTESITDSIQKLDVKSVFQNQLTENKSMKIDQSFFNVATVNNSNILVKGKLFDALNNQEIAKAEEFDEIEKSRRSRIAYNNEDSKTSYKENEKKSVNEEKKYDAEYTIQKDKELLKAKKAKEIIPSQIQETSSPLLVIDGVPIKNDYNNDTFDQDDMDELKKDNDWEDVIFLKEPIYVINGVEYSEESLFGKKPTSPYYPLEKQEMTSISILKPEKAILLYGKKGEKGIVIISTKNGKPAQKK